MLRQSTSLILIPIILLGFALRLHNLDVVPLRGDEAFSALYWAEMPIMQSLTEIASIEPHPPLTYVTFHLWHMIVGGIDAPFTLRMLGVLANLIGIPVMYAIGKHLTQNRFVGYICALLWAMHPFEIWHSQDFRNYAIWAGLSTTTLWFGLRLITYDRKVDWALYILLAVVSAFTFYTELLTLGAFGIFVLLTCAKRRPFVTRFLGIQSVIVVSVIVGFLVFQGNLLTGGGYGGNVQPFAAPDYLTRFVPTLLLGDSIPPELSSSWLPLTLALLMLIGCVYQHSKYIAIFVLALLIVPLATLGIVSTRVSIFHPRYVIAVVPSLILIVTIGSYVIADFLSKKLALHRNLITVVIISPWFILSAITLNHYYTVAVYQKAPAWDELGAFLDKNVSENDLVIQLSADPAFSYYYKGDAKDTGLPVSPTQPEAEIITELESAQSEYDSLYIVSNPNPDWQNAHVLENWANQHMQSVRLSSASGLGIRHYKTWEVSESISQDTLVQFDDIVELLDFKLFDTPLPTGEIVLWLYWRPLEQSDASLKTFVHVVGDINPATNSPLWSQDDQFPQDGRLDSTTWEVNTVYRDVYYLPSDSLQENTYQIIVGWYNPETNTRLDTNPTTDTYAVTTLTVP